jgi:eukaryotic-like serine/threonine-protein kinase
LLSPLCGILFFVGRASEISPDTLLGGKIRLIQRIGRGGMGDVWIARNEATHAEVAVKTLQKAERSSVHDERFRREARLAATISHRNVVRVFDLVDDPDGTLCLVMELLRGGTLEKSLRERGALPSIHAVAIAVPILSALNHVHQKGIIHRDLKPANIFFSVEPDEHVIPKILDFGIAKLPAAGSALTVDGSVLGTPHYMSPEQIRGREDIDGRSDMFSVAVCVYEMLTGSRVFQRDTAAASLAAVLEHEVDPDPRIEPRLWVALSRALAKRAYERYATCAEFAEALRNAMDASEEDLAQSVQELRPLNSGPTPHPTSGVANVEVPSHPKQPAAMRPLAILVGVAAVAAVLGVTVTLALTRSRNTAPASADSEIVAATATTVGSVPALPVATPIREASPDPADSAAAQAEPASSGQRPAPAKPLAGKSRAPASKSTSKTAPAKTGGGVATKPGF